MDGCNNHKVVIKGKGRSRICHVGRGELVGDEFVDGYVEHSDTPCGGISMLRALDKKS